MFIVGGGYRVSEWGVMSVSHDVYAIDLSRAADWSLLSRDVLLSTSLRPLAVVDETRRRLLFIGSPADTIRTLSLDTSGTWSRLAPPDRPAPAPRCLAIAPTLDGSSFVTWTSPAIWTVPFADARFDSTYEAPRDTSLGYQPSALFGRQPDRGALLFLGRIPDLMHLTPPGSLWLLDETPPARWRPLETVGTPP
jgi:hypothetical protein